MLAAVTRSPGDFPGSGAGAADGAAERADGSGGQQVVVFGAGPIGLATLIAAAATGSRVLVLDPVRSRRELASGTGAELALWGTPADLLAAAQEWTRGQFSHSGMNGRTLPLTSRGIASTCLTLTPG